MAQVHRARAARGSEDGAVRACGEPIGRELPQRQSLLCACATLSPRWRNEAVTNKTIRTARSRRGGITVPSSVRLKTAPRKQPPLSVAIIISAVEKRRERTQ